MKENPAISFKVELNFFLILFFFLGRILCGFCRDFSVYPY